MPPYRNSRNIHDNACQMKPNAHSIIVACSAAPNGDEPLQLLQIHHSPGAVLPPSQPHRGAAVRGA